MHKLFEELFVSAYVGVQLVVGFLNSLGVLKAGLGKGLGNKVTGALMARMPSGSLGTTAGGGRTARPWAMDQSLMTCTRCSCSRASREGGNVLLVGEAAMIKALLFMSVRVFERVLVWSWSASLWCSRLRGRGSYVGRLSLASVPCSLVSRVSSKASQG